MESAWPQSEARRKRNHDLCAMLGRTRKDVQQADSKDAESTVSLVGFRPVYVWDVLQTEGKELPQHDSEVKGDVGSSLARLVSFTIEQGIKFGHSENIAPARGIDPTAGPSDPAESEAEAEQWAHRNSAQHRIGFAPGVTRSRLLIGQQIALCRRWGSNHFRHRPAHWQTTGHASKTIRYPPRPRGFRRWQANRSDLQLAQTLR